MVVVCDLLKTPCIYRYNDETKSLEFVSCYRDDHTWTTAVHVIDKGHILASDAALNMNLFAIDMQRGLTSDIIKLEGSIHTSEFVNKIIEVEKISLHIFPSTDNKEEGRGGWRNRNNILYCTVNGSLCIMSEVDSDTFDILHVVEEEAKSPNITMYTSHGKKVAFVDIDCIRGIMQQSNVHVWDDVLNRSRTRLSDKYPGISAAHIQNVLSRAINDL